MQKDKDAKRQTNNENLKYNFVFFVYQATLPAERPSVVPSSESAFCHFFGQFSESSGFGKS